MRVARPSVEFLQWFGLLAAPIAWTGQLIVGFGATIAKCAAGGSRWGIPIVTWQIAITAAAATVVVLGQAAAITAWRETRAAEHDGPPPEGRVHFFAVAAALGNVLFLGIVLLSGIGTATLAPCHQA